MDLRRLTLWPEWLPAFRLGKNVENRKRKPAGLKTGRWIAFHAGKSYGGRGVGLGPRYAALKTVAQAAEAAGWSTFVCNNTEHGGPQLLASRGRGACKERKRFCAWRLDTTNPPPDHERIWTGRIVALAYIESLHGAPVGKPVHPSPWSFPDECQLAISEMLWLPEPIAHKGSQGLMPLKEPDLRAIRAQLDPEDWQRVEAANGELGDGEPLEGGV